MACPALPLCGLAIGEAERAMPDVAQRVRALLVKLGMPNEAIVMRMTGCPNGCSRPYMAEIGFVGDGPNTYQVSDQRGRGQGGGAWIAFGSGFTRKRALSALPLCHMPGWPPAPLS